MFGEIDLQFGSGLVLLGIGLLMFAVAQVYFLYVTFRQGILWGLGVFFIPFMNLVFLIKFWEESKKPFFWGLGGGALCFMGGAIAITSGQSLGGLASLVNQKPIMAYEEFREAVGTGDMTRAFQHLTVESQSGLLAVPITSVQLMKAVAAGSSTADPRMQSLAAIFARHGVQAPDGQLVTPSLESVSNKGLCFQELTLALSDGKVPWADMKAALPSPLTNLVLSANSATAESGKTKVHFKQAKDAWLVNLDESEAVAEGMLAGSLENLNRLLMTELARKAQEAQRLQSPRRSTATLDQLKAGVKQTPENSKAWYELAAKQAAFGRWDECLSDLKRALALNRKELEKNPGAKNLMTMAMQDYRLRLVREKPEFARLMEDIKAGKGDGGAPPKVSTPPAGKSAPGAFEPTADYAVTNLHGFNLHLSSAAQRHPVEMQATLSEISRQLAGTKASLPSEAWTEVQKTPIWIEWTTTHNESISYHPSVEWLKEHGLNPDKAQSVEVGNCVRFLEWCREDQPFFMLQQLAFAWHNRVVGEKDDPIKAAYANAKARGLYQVIRWSNGNEEKRPAHAMIDERAYFAELSKAYFGINNYFPFKRVDLKTYDPVGYAAIEKMWGIVR